MSDANVYQYTESGLRTLAQQELDLQQAEIAGKWLLEAYTLGGRGEIGAESGELKPLNYATFAKTQDSSATGKVVLVEVRDAAKIGEVIAQQERQGRALVLYSPVYVSGEPSKVAAFRPK